MLLVLVLVLVVIVLLQQLNDNMLLANRISQSRYQDYLLSNGLRQTSDDLTRMVRLYAATGEQRYRDYFDEILNMRNGLTRRPADYHEIPYRDILLATGQFDGTNVEPVPITVLAEIAGFTE